MACIHREGGIGCGVRFMYAFSMVNQFLVGPPLYVLSGMADTDPLSHKREEAVQLVLYSLIGFVVGAYLVAPQVMRRPHLRVDREWRSWTAPDRLEAQWQVAVALVVAGSIALVGIGPFYAIPTMRAIVSQLILLLDTGLTFMAIYVMLSGRRDRLSTMLICLLVSSAYRAIGTGFFGNSVNTALYLLAILTMGRQSSVKAWAYLGFSLYLLLIPYGIWLNVRAGIREGIWKGASFEERVLTIKFEGGRGTYLFNLLDPEDLRLIQHRIDQSHLLSSAMQFTPSREPHAWGYSMVEDILMAMVPRLLWPNKPLSMGGSRFVSKYTGIKFAATVSVGINFLFEFYVNFGSLGTVICVAFFGVVCGVLDYLFFRFGFRSFFAQWTILMSMWSICVWSERMAQIAMTLPVALFNSWLFARFLRTVGWAPLYYTPPAARVAARTPDSEDIAVVHARE